MTLSIISIVTIAVEQTDRTLMLINKETVLIGSKVFLVPYRRQHVERYHEWMKSAELQQQTASEPLSLEEEYAMQKSWHQDEDKLTFIVLAMAAQCETDGKDLTALLEKCPMAGDVNLFISSKQDDGEQGFDAELEVMIAEPAFRRQGLAKEALSMLMAYATSSPTLGNQSGMHKSTALPLRPADFLAKIGDDNAASIAMFERLGFCKVKHSSIWREIEMRPDPGRSLTMQSPLAVRTWPLST